MSAVLRLAFTASALLVFSGCLDALLVREAPESAEGARALEANELASARALYEALERAYPGGPDIELSLGAVALDEQKDEEAIRRAKSALSDEPIDSRLASTVDPLMRRALRARDELLKASLDERGGRAHHNVGMVHLGRAIGERNKGNRDEAREAFDAAIESFERSLIARPGDRDTAFNLELALILRDEAEAMEPPPQDQKDQDKEDGQDGSDDGSEHDRDESDDRNKGEDGGERRDQDQDQGERERQEQDEDGEPGEKGEAERNEGERSLDDDADSESEAPQDEEDHSPEEPDAREMAPGADDSELDERSAGAPIEAKSRDEAERLLRALEASDQSLENHLSKRRASRSRRFVEKDW